MLALLWVCKAYTAPDAVCVLSLHCPPLSVMTDAFTLNHVTWNEQGCFLCCVMALVYYPPIHVEGLHPAAGGLSQPSIFSFNPAAIETWEPSAEVAAGWIVGPNFTCPIALVSNSDQANRWKTIVDLSFLSGRTYVHHDLLFSLFFAVADMIHFTAGGLLLAVLP